MQENFLHNDICIIENHLYVLYSIMLRAFILHQMKEKNACNKVIDYLYTCAKTIMYMPFVQHNIKENFPLILWNNTIFNNAFSLKSSL